MGLREAIRRGREPVCGWLHSTCESLAAFNPQTDTGRERGLPGQVSGEAEPGGVPQWKEALGDLWEEGPHPRQGCGGGLDVHPCHPVLPAGTQHRQAPVPLRPGPPPLAHGRSRHSQVRLLGAPQVRAGPQGTGEGAGVKALAG